MVVFEYLQLSAHGAPLQRAVQQHDHVPHAVPLPHVLEIVRGARLAVAREENVGRLEVTCTSVG
jgi:hypothetical protein